MSRERVPRLLVLKALGVGLLLLAGRLPLHLATARLPVSNDDAIPLLMARHVLRGELSTILWNQPYNGALEAYLLAAGLAIAPPHHAFRAYEALCGVALVVLAGLLAGRAAGERAGWVAAALAAWGTPYMALMAATGPPPNFLVPLLVGLVAWAGMDVRPVGGPPRHPLAAAGWGLVAGLAIWDSALAVPALLGVGLGLVLAGWRPRLPAAACFLAGLAVGLLPLVVARTVGASASSPVTDLRPRWLWVAGLQDLVRAAAGLFGVQVPLVVDGPERIAPPLGVGWLLAAALLAVVVAGAAPSGRRAWPLVGWAAALAGAFAVSRRTGGDEVRYLFGLTVPVLALAGAGLAWLWSRRRAVAVAAGLVLWAVWGYGHLVVAGTWRDPRHARDVWQVPPLEPALALLERAGVRSVYASLQFAGRLAVAGGGRLTVSQAWNERIPGDPLRFRDEVDLDPRAAWVLSDRLSRGMPRAAGFREILGRLGGRWTAEAAGEMYVFHGFTPPYDESHPVPVEALAVRSHDGAPLPHAVLDRDAATSWTSAYGITRGSGLAVVVDPPRRVSALVLLVSLEDSPLGTAWACDVDGTIAVQGPARHGLQWVNGVPRAGRQAMLAVALDGRMAREVRLLFQEAGPPLVVGDVFLYGPDEAGQPPAGASAADAALEAARAGRWPDAVRLYGDAARAEPHRASYHANLARARWRAGRRTRIDVESLDDGGPGIVARKR
jgi:hypothetical protein